MVIEATFATSAKQPQPLESHGFRRVMNPCTSMLVDSFRCFHFVVVVYKMLFCEHGKGNPQLVSNMDCVLQSSSKLDPS